MRINGTLEPKTQLQDPTVEVINNKIDKLYAHLDKILPVISVLVKTPCVLLALTDFA